MSRDVAASSEERINCLRCMHFYVTWERRFPRGCRAYNIKSVQMPSVVIRASSGTPCLQFSPKS